MQSYSTVCLDASLVVRMHDPDSVEFETVMQLWDQWSRDGVHFIAPSLIRFEITNATFKSVRAGVLGASDGTQILSSAFSLPIQLFDDLDLSILAVEISRTLNLKAAYDGHYIALAKRQDAMLVTADRRLVRAASDRYPFVRHILDDETPRL